MTKDPALFNKERLIVILSEIAAEDDILIFKNKISDLKTALNNEIGGNGLIASIEASDVISMRRDLLVSELDQILEAQTLERAKYYLKRLEKGVSQVKTGKVNDINLYRWKEYDGIITDSLWVIPRRDTSGAHLGWYWGNFIPQIPHQMILRYSKENDWVLDAFAGSGTTLIECRKLGRNGIGIELNREIAQRAEGLIIKEPNPWNISSEMIVGDAKTIDYQETFARFGVQQVQLIIMHPPYHDIIPFSDDAEDLSNAGTTEDFLAVFAQVVKNLTPALEKERYLALVIGDKYARGEWIPLGFYCMQEVLTHGYLLKSIIVKNFDETRAKREQKELWRYRALAGGFYVFKHEYIFVFQKQ
jgi:16S rRNA G966 N2-methylase RsmD